MNTNYNSAQPAFTAKLIVSGIKLDPKKVDAVGKKVAEYTRHYANDTLYIRKEQVPNENGGFFNAIDFANNKTSAGFVLELPAFKKWFNETNVDDIAKSFTRVFKYAKLKEIKRAKMDALRENFSRALAGAELNKSKFENTKNTVYKTLSINCDRRAKKLESEIKKNVTYYQSINDKITDNPIKDLINWWEEF